MEVFSAGRGCTASRARRSTRRGSDVIGGDDLAGHPGGDGAPQGFAAVRFFNGPFLQRLAKRTSKRHSRSSRPKATSADREPYQAHHEQQN